MAFSLEKNFKIYIIIPSFNEGTVLHRTLSEVSKTGYGIILVDDGSTDHTTTIIKGFDLHYLKHKVNLGQGAALQTGMDHAKTLDADIVIHFDADGQHRIEDIPNMIAPILINKADIVLGSRFINKQYAEQVPTVKNVLLKFAKLIDTVISGIKLTDSHNGFRALGRHALQNIQFKSNRMAHASEILLEIKKNNLKYIEVPVSIIYTPYSISKKNLFMETILTVGEIILVLIYRLLHYVGNFNSKKQPSRAESHN